jgi:hypothetical protein
MKITLVLAVILQLIITTVIVAPATLNAHNDNIKSKHWSPGLPPAMPSQPTMPSKPFFPPLGSLHDNNNKKNKISFRSN